MMTEKRFEYDKDTCCFLDYNEWGIKGKSIEEIERLLNALHEENEQLKQRNDRQAKQLDRLYCLIEEKEWRVLTDILDDFKRCEEQLQRESGTYGDVE